jgi:hypothetical protein
MSDYHTIKEHTFENNEKIKLCSDSFSLGDIYFVVFVDAKGEEHKIIPNIPSVRWFANRMYKKMMRSWIPPGERINDRT